MPSPTHSGSSFSSPASHSHAVMALHKTSVVPAVEHARLISPLVMQIPLRQRVRPVRDENRLCFVARHEASRRRRRRDGTDRSQVIGSGIPRLGLAGFRGSRCRARSFVSSRQVIGRPSVFARVKNILNIFGGGVCSPRARPNAIRFGGEGLACRALGGKRNGGVRNPVCHCLIKSGRGTAPRIRYFVFGTFKVNFRIPSATVDRGARRLGLCQRRGRSCPGNSA